MLLSKPAPESGKSNEKASMHEKQKFLERVVIGLVAVAIAVDVLASELPRVMPYIAVLAVIYVIVRLVLFHMREW
jgi:heme/copper-type cytochrome/quinol oxidase subunit 4